MKKKNQLKNPSSQGLNFDDFKWCIDNDFQVYVVPLVDNDIPTGEYKIGVRRGGINSLGKDAVELNGVIYRSKETLSELTFKNQKEALDHLNYVYGLLRRKYS
jgi:hypothetical protein